jgi:hypothetical protein
MSSILDALAKLDPVESKHIREIQAPARRRTRRRVTVAAIALAFAAGAGLAVMLVRARTEPVLVTAAPPARITPPPPADPTPPAARRALPVVPPVPAPAIAPGESDRPQGRVAHLEGGPRPVAPPAALAAIEPEPIAPPPARVAPVAPPPVMAPVAVAPRPVPQAAVAPAPVVPAASAPAQNGPATVASRPPQASPSPATASAGAPSIRVSFLVYSRTAERRSVALAVGDGSLTTLHEGESASGIEVTRILPDRVELRHDGRPFTVRAQN